MEKEKMNLTNNFNIVLTYIIVSLVGGIILFFAEAPLLFMIIYLVVSIIAIISMIIYQLKIVRSNYKYQDIMQKATILSKAVYEKNLAQPSQKDTQNSENNSFKVFDGNTSTVKMNDIASYEEVKEELSEIIDFLKNPADYHKMGAKIPKGVIFMGPPGTGKTMFAKAVAGDANVKFIYTSGSEFVEKYVGVGAGRVRDIFAEAKKDNAPCIIFIDEIDAIGGKRNATGTDVEKDKTLNQLLVEMDGFEETNNVVVIAATNRIDMLDEALLRPGRFDRHIQIGLPTENERLEILRVQSLNKKLSKNFDFTSLARKTPYFSGAQLAAVLNEAALLAVRNHVSHISNELAEEAIDRVLMGPSKKSREYIERERKIVAYHEAGHAVVGLTLENAMQVEKITIIPRGDAGGYNLFSQKEETFFQTKNEIIAEITSLLGGRAAEELFFDDVTSGASGDLKRATELAKRYVCCFGMSNLGLMQISENSSISQATSQKIDNEINAILDECYLKSKGLIQSHKNLLIAISNSLLEKETIDSTQIQELASQYC